MLTVSSLGIKWDVRDPPAHLRQMRGNTRLSNGLAASALSTQKNVLCVISYDFPWTLAISTQDSRPLTVMDVLEALYQTLHKEVRRSEWALAPDVQRYIMLKANKARRKSTMAMGIRRVDWLGTRCLFRGLERDDDLARRRLMPGDQPTEVWVARFGSMHL
ncbi:hypothetical protein M422DRAFT_225291 [Sphaerobolus stellatus SS14]|nr:hypothetical protein M422DRAFT_225291 [Sphaerobolus stellatus SS14]